MLFVVSPWWTEADFAFTRRSDGLGYRGQPHQVGCRLRLEPRPLIRRAFSAFWRRAALLRPPRRRPSIVAGGGATGFKGNRHIKFNQPTPLANLHLTLMNKVGVRLDKFADSDGKMDELFSPLSI